RRREPETVHAAQVLPRGGVVHVQAVVLDETSEQERPRILRHRDRADLTSCRDLLYAPVRGKIIDPDFGSWVFVRLGPAAMHDREQPAAGTVQGQVLQPPGAPTLRPLRLTHQRPLSRKLE